MYQAHPQGAPFSRPRALAQQPAQGRGSDGMSQVVNYQVAQFPPPTQLPEELESAISVRVQGAREEDAHLLNQISRQQLLDPRLHREGQGQRSDGMPVPSRGAAFHAHPAPLTSDDQPEQQRGVDWFKYQTPSKLFAQQQPPQASHANPSSGLSRGGMPGWSIPFTEPAHSQGGDVQGLYAPESAGSILASFGLSNEDLEVLSHYPDDQLTPDTLPFILRDIQIHKRNAPFSQSLPAVPDLPPPQPPRRSHSPDIPSFLSVTQTAGKVIDYGHASRTSEESRDSYKRVRFSKEKAKAEAEYQSSNSPLNLKTESPKGHHSKDSSDSKRLEYKRHTPSPETLTRTQMSVREATSKTWSDRDARSKTSHSSETRIESSKLSRPSSFKENCTKRLPTPTMMSDFSADPPKVYPHSCSLCDVECERAKDWIEHVNTVNHTASCRDLRNRYPHWKPNLPREQPLPAQDARSTWRSQDRSPSRSVSRSLSWSPSPSPPPERCRRTPPPPSGRHHGRSYSPLHHPHHHHHPQGYSHRSPVRRSSRRSPSLNSHRLEKRTSESSGVSTGSSSRDGQKRSCDDLAKHTFGPSSSTAKASRQSSRAGASGKRESSLSSRGRSSNSKSPACESRKANRPPSSASSSSSTSMAGSRTKALTSPSSSSSLAAANPRSKGSKPAISVAVNETKAGQQSEAAKAPPAKKKKRKQLLSPDACRLVYLTGLPVDTAYQEVTDMVDSFGEINNIILFPNPGEDEGQPQYKRASVCMERVKDAQALATCLTLSIRDHPISVSAGTKAEEEQTIPVVIEGKVVSVPKAPTKTNTVDQGPVTEVGQKISNEKGVVLILGLPGSGFSRSDLSELVCPFAASAEIIMAPEQKKALVTLPDMESAQEMVKVYTASPVQINDHQLVMRYLRQPVELSTPVALYGAIMEHSPLAPVSWNSLLVVSNVPATATGPAEVQKLVQRFGAIKQTLVLNHNKSSTIIFEMATPNIALSVNKRFLRYPCIIQNNPLAFSRKPDPKKSNNKMAAADPKSTGVAPANGNDSQTSVVTAPSGGEEESSPHSSPNRETISEVKEEEANKSSLQPAEGSHGGVTVAKTDSPPDQVKDEVTDTVANISTKSNVTEADVSGTDISTRSDETEATVSDTTPQVADKEEEDVPETSLQAAVPDTDKNVLKLAEEPPKVMSQLVAALRQECRTRASSGKRTAELATGSQAPPGLPKVTPEMLKALLQECRARSFSRASVEQAKKEQAPASGQKCTAEKTHNVVALSKRSLSGDTGEDMEQVAKMKTQEEDQGRKRRRGEKERERRTSHRAGSSGSGGSRSSMRSERSRRGSRPEREDKPKTVWVAESVELQKEEDGDDVGEETMAFDMEDFVTVDEVGDVAEVPHPPLNTPEATVEDTTTSPASVTEQQAPEDTAQMQVEVELDTGKVGTVLDKREEEGGESPPPSIATTKEGSVKTPEGIKEDNVLVCQDEVINEPRVTVDKAASCEVTEESEVKGHQKATLTGGELEKGVEDFDKATFVTVDQVGLVEGGEERRRGVEERKALGKVASKRWRERKSQDEREEEELLGKRPRREPLFHADYSIPTFNSDSPIGMEFLVPKTGFFCKVCAKFYSGTEEAKRNHCRSLKHYQNLEKSLEKWKAKEDGHSVAS